MSIKSITSLFLAVCALWVPMALADSPGYIEITDVQKASELDPAGEETQDYFLTNGCELILDKSFVTSTAIRSFGDGTTSTLVFTADSSSASPQAVLTTLTASSIWAGYVSGQNDWCTNIQITLDAKGVQALQQVMTGGGRYEQDIIIATSTDVAYGVKECCSNAGAFTLSGENLGWEIVAELQDSTYVVQEGQMALIGYDKTPVGGIEDEPDYYYYSRIALVVNGGSPATPEPATASLSLLALAALCVRRRR